MCATRKLYFWVIVVLRYYQPSRASKELVLEAAKDPWGRSPLHEAAEHGHTSLVKKILAGDPAAASATDELGWTALHWTAFRGNEDAASALLSARAPVDATDKHFGCQPLHWAARRGHLAMLQLLLGSGASATALDGEGRSAADWAALTGHGLAAAFLEGRLKGLNASFSNETRSSDSEGHWSMTALHLAAANGHTEKLRQALQDLGNESKPHVFAQKDQFSRTPLIAGIQAAGNSSKSRSEASMAALELLKATPLSAAAVVDADGRSALQWAVLAGLTEIASRLLELQPAVAAEVDRWGRSLVHHAAANGHPELLQTLLRKKVASVDLADGTGQTALHLAAASGHRDAVQQLLKAKASVGPKDLLQRVPLHYAAIRGRREVMKVLVDSRASLPALKDMDGFTALDFARNLGHSSSVKLLAKR